MQLIFGDNKSKYDLLFSEGKIDEAKSVKEMIRLSFSTLTEERDVYGYMSFGANSNRPLFFCARKDTLLKRSVYYLHAVYHELRPDYFFGKEYIKDMVLDFIDQDAFNALRDNPDGFSLEPKPNTALLNAQTDIPEEKLIDILGHLYQRSKLIIVVDDDKYNSNYVRVLLKKVFEYLTPSLRKICSYIVGMADTESMNFMIRVIPKSMYKKDSTACVDLSVDTLSVDKGSAAYKLAERIVGAKEDYRQWLFEFYESVHYGSVSTYQKQRFLEFISNLENNSSDSCEGYEVMLTEYLEDDRYNEADGIPPLLRKEIEPFYKNKTYVKNLLPIDRFNEDAPLEFINDAYTELRKIYFLADPKLSCVTESVISKYAALTIDYPTFTAKVKMNNAYVENKKVYKTSESAFERSFISALELGLVDFVKRLKMFKEIANDKEKLFAVVDKVLASYVENKKLVEGSAVDAVVYKASSAYIANNQSAIKEFGLNIESCISTAFNSRIEEHNKRTKAILAKMAADKLDNDLEEAYQKAINGFDGIEDKIKAAFAEVNAIDKSSKEALPEIELGYRSRLLEMCKTPQILIDYKDQDEKKRLDRLNKFRASFVADHLLVSYRYSSNDFFKKNDKILKAVNKSNGGDLIAVAESLIEKALMTEELESSKSKQNEGLWLWLPYMAQYEQSFFDLINDLSTMLEKHSQAVSNISSADLSKCTKLMAMTMDAIENRASEEEVVSLIERCDTLVSGALAENKNAVKIIGTVKSYISKNAVASTKEKSADSVKKSAKNSAEDAFAINDKKKVKSEKLDNICKADKSGNGKMDLKTLIIFGAIAAVIVVGIVICVIMLLPKSDDNDVSESSTPAIESPAEPEATPGNTDSNNPPAQNGVQPEEIPNENDNGNEA